MDFLNEAKAVATMAVPGPGAPEEVRAAFAALPIAELAARWRALQFVGIKGQTEETWAATRYFDALPYDAPVRAYEMILAVLAAETDRSVRLWLSDLMSRLLGMHGASLIARIETDAAGNPALRWLLGGTYWWVQDDAIQRRLVAFADVDAYRADEEAHKSRSAPIDFDVLSLEELASLWVEQTSKPFKDHDDNWQAFRDYERDLIECDPDAMIDMIIAVLKTENDPLLLSVLAAGPLEDVISMQVIDRIEREAAADRRFLELLAGVWYSDKPNAVQARLNGILGRRGTPGRPIAVK
jgi:hypothetical protein